MGVVYRARNLALDRVRALKVLAPGALRRPALSRALPARVAAGGRDRAPARDPGAPGGRGGRPPVPRRCAWSRAATCASWSPTGPLDPGEARRGDRARSPAGLDAAHAAGLIHRDVKPANVLVGGGADAGRVYLTDFGISRTTGGGETVTGTGELVGTADFVAPEQIAGEPVDAPRRRLRARRRPALRAHRQAAVPARERARDPVRARERAPAAAVGGAPRALARDSTPWSPGRWRSTRTSASRRPARSRGRSTRCSRASRTAARRARAAARPGRRADPRLPAGRRSAPRPLVAGARRVRPSRPRSPRSSCSPADGGDDADAPPAAVADAGRRSARRRPASRRPGARLGRGPRAATRSTRSTWSPTSSLSRSAVAAPDRGRGRLRLGLGGEQQTDALYRLDPLEGTDAARDPARRGRRSQRRRRRRATGSGSRRRARRTSSGSTRRRTRPPATFRWAPSRARSPPARARSG